MKKIPQAVLARCEWGRDDYSLRIAEAPPAPDDTSAPPAAEPAAPKRSRKRTGGSAEPSLFAALDAKGVGK